MRLIAESFQHDPSLLAGLVAAYQRRHQLDDWDLMHVLGIDAAGLTHLVLSPKPTVPCEVDALHVLARRVGCSEMSLRAILAED